MTTLVQLQTPEGEPLAMVELPDVYPTPRIIVLDGVAYERKIDLLVYVATSYMWISNDINLQRLVNDAGQQVWQAPLTKEVIQIKD